MAHTGVGPTSRRGRAPCARIAALLAFALASACGEARPVGGAALDCTTCHPSPGASGAHAAHADPLGGPLSTYGDLRTFEDRAVPGAGYLFGCGHCHPLDSSRHMDGRVDVELSPAGAPAGSLRARNDPSAAFVRAPEGSGYCIGSYCHGPGREGPPGDAFTPLWRETAPLRCDGCHGAPPRYPSGPAGSATANSHVYGRELSMAGTTFVQAMGHFTWHDYDAWALRLEEYGKHGVHQGNDAGGAPLTCQACHYETVDPVATGEDGFYWFNTASSYGVPPHGNGYSCAAYRCHDGTTEGSPPPGAGRTSPLRHVNGRRDVAFDPRTAAPTVGVPAPPNAPRHPYWIANSMLNPAHLPRSGGAFDGTTLSFELSAARYDPETKACTNVSCHLGGQVDVVWGAQVEDLVASCPRCHATIP